MSFRAIFPHNHNFAEAIQDEFVSLTKWLKLVHNYKKKPFTAESPLPSDLYIKVSLMIFTNSPYFLRTYLSLIFSGRRIDSRNDRRSIRSKTER